MSVQGVPRFISQSASQCATVLACCLVAAAAFFPPLLVGQTMTHAQITGIVSDSTGASIPGARVEALNNDTGVTYGSETNEAGVYVLPQLVPGPYEVTTSSEGFETVRQTGIVLRLGDRQSLNFDLNVGTITETVEVIASAQLLTLDDASHAHVISNDMITNIPQLQRDTLAAIAQLNPSVQGQDAQLLGEGWDVAIAVNGVGYSLAGGQVNATAISVDGAIGAGRRSERGQPGDTVAGLGGGVSRPDRRTDRGRRALLRRGDHDLVTERNQ